MKYLTSFAILLTSISFIACKNTKEKESKLLRIEKQAFGQLASGENVELFTLRNTLGMEVDIMNYGGTIVRWTAPDKDGNYDDITLGMDSLKGYLNGVPYFGALVGRYGNRIANAKFTLNGTSYDLAVNNGVNSLHGGIKGFDKVLWTADVINETEGKLVLSYLSKDGEEGYPGNLKVKVTYELKDDNSLSIDYEATTDQKTVVNLTNHAYFNLGGLGSRVLDHEVMIAADTYLPVDKGLIPTGEMMSVENSPMDFTDFHGIGERLDDTTYTQIALGGGYDHCWVFTDQSDVLRKVAEVREASSGRSMEVFTTEPAVQFYTGNFLDGSIIGKKGISYGKRSGFCLETQHFPDSPNQSQFPSTVLDPSDTYKSTTVFKFGILE